MKPGDPIEEVEMPEGQHEEDEPGNVGVEIGGPLPEPPPKAPRRRVRLEGAPRPHATDPAAATPEEAIAHEYARKFGEARELSDQLNDLLIELSSLRPSREVSIAITKAEEADMWLAKAWPPL